MVESFESRFTEFEQLLRTARSVRKNLDLSRAIDPEDLRAAIDVAVQAPTGLLERIGDFWWSRIPIKRRNRCNLRGNTDAADE